MHLCQNSLCYILQRGGGEAQRSPLGRDKLPSRSGGGFGRAWGGVVAKHVITSPARCGKPCHVPCFRNCSISLGPNCSCSFTEAGTGGRAWLHAAFFPVHPASSAMPMAGMSLWHVGVTPLLPRSGGIYLDLSQWNCWHEFMWTWDVGLGLGRDFGFGGCCWNCPLPGPDLPSSLLFSPPCSSLPLPLLLIYLSRQLLHAALLWEDCCGLTAAILEAHSSLRPSFRRSFVAARVCPLLLVLVVVAE